MTTDLARASSTLQPGDYISARPGQDGALVGAETGARKDLSVGRTFRVGSLTFDPSKTHSGAENLFHGVSLGATPESRVTVSGIGQLKPGGFGQYSDFFAIAGVARDGALITARDFKAKSPVPPEATPGSGHPCDKPKAEDLWLTECAGNSRGIRVFLGYDLRGSLEVPPDPMTGWFFLRSASTYLAIRIPNTGVRAADASGSSVPVQQGSPIAELRLDAWRATTDIWTPVVMQAGAATDFASFSDFKAQVQGNVVDNGTTIPRYSVDPLGNVKYHTLKPSTVATSDYGSVLELGRQKDVATLPKVNGQPVSLVPSFGGQQFSYLSPYVSMGYRASSAILLGPSGQATTIPTTFP